VGSLEMIRQERQWQGDSEYFLLQRRKNSSAAGQRGTPDGLKPRAGVFMSASLKGARTNRALRSLRGVVDWNHLSLEAFTENRLRSETPYVHTLASWLGRGILFLRPTARVAGPAAKSTAYRGLLEHKAGARELRRLERDTSHRDAMRFQWNGSTKKDGNPMSRRKRLPTSASNAAWRLADCTLRSRATFLTSTSSSVTGSGYTSNQSGGAVWPFDRKSAEFTFRIKVDIALRRDPQMGPAGFVWG